MKMEDKTEYATQANVTLVLEAVECPTSVACTALHNTRDVSAAVSALLDLGWPGRGSN